MSEDLIVDPVISGLIPPLTPEELAGLEENIRKFGCISPLVGWKGKGILLDGHNRKTICERLGVGYVTRWLEFPDREEAELWVYRNQFGRRNLTADQMSLLRGRYYNRVKDKRGNPLLKVAKSGVSDEIPQKCQSGTIGRTSQDIAEIEGVSRRTVHRDGRFAEAVETVAKVMPDLPAQVTSGKAPTRKKIMEAAAVAKSDPAKAKEILTSEQTVEVKKDFDPDRPWADFEDEMNGVMGEMMKLRIKIGKLLDYDSDTRQLHGEWAHFYSYTGAIEDLNRYIRHMKNCIPAALDDKNPGYISAELARARKQVEAR